MALKTKRTHSHCNFSLLGGQYMTKKHRKGAYCIASLADMLICINDLQRSLEGKIEFDKSGLPIFKREHFLQEIPEYVAPFPNRGNRLYAEPDKTAICFFCGDKFLYTRLKKVWRELDIYKQFQGVAFLDITVTDDMDIEWQRLIMLANQLFAAVLAVNGIKLIFNTRCGSRSTWDCLKQIPDGIMAISGFLGCSNAHNFFETVEFIDKILMIRPSQLLIYGKSDKWVDDVLERMGIRYRYFMDFRKQSKRRAG